MSTVSLIMAVSENDVIGDKNKLPWYLPADLRRFKDITIGKKVIMGRRTHQSIGRPLPNRENIVMTRNPNFSAPGCKTVGSLNEALSLANENEEVFVIGGAEVFKLAEPLALTIYLTQIHANINGDILFKIDSDRWTKISKKTFPSDSANQYSYSFVTLKKIV